MDSAAASSAAATPPPTKKSRYERRHDGAASDVLVSRALRGAAESVGRATPSASTSGTATPASSSRLQFEQQEDFISFDFDDDDEPPSKNSPRGSASRGGPSGSKRKLDEFEERKDEGSKRLVQREKGRTTPWCSSPGVDWAKCDDAITMLNAECWSFITYISPTPIEHELRLWTIELIRRTIKSRWSDAEVECFGSVGTGLYLPGGDIDLVVLCPSFPSPPLKPTSSLLHHLASLLLNSSLADPSSLIVIAKARVPIVKFTTRYGRFSVDLSVNQKNGVEAAMRVRDMLETFAFRGPDYVEPGVPSVKGKEKAESASREEGEESEDTEWQKIETVDYGVARSLVILVKAFLNQRGMNEVFTGGLGSYSIICMVVSFLQLHPKIQTGEILPEKNIGLLFVEFLEYYGKHFNFNEAGITLRGRGGYFNKHDKGWFRPNQPYLLSIEDPNDPTNDVSGGSHNIIRVRQTLAGAFDVLTATLYHRTSHFEAAHNPSLIPLTGAALPNADHDAASPLTQSILGSVLGMSRAAIVARESNIALHREGVLQAKLRQTTVAPLGSKKAMKRALKEAREAAKRDRTIARLEKRKDLREQKQERKDKKKRELQEATAVPVQAETDLGDVDDEEDSNDGDGDGSYLPVARNLFQADGEEDSRYSITSVIPKNDKGKAKAPVEVLYVHGSNSEEGSDDDEEASASDDDVVMGGHHGGDRLVARSNAKLPVSPVGGGALDSGSDDSSGSEAVRRLVIPKAAESKEAKAARLARKNVYWSKKGAREGNSALREYDD